MFWNFVTQIGFFILSFILIEYEYYHHYSPLFISLTIFLLLNNIQSIFFSYKLFQQNEQILKLYSILLIINSIFFFSNVILQYLYPTFITFYWLQLVMNFYNILYYHHLNKRIVMEEEQQSLRQDYPEATYLF